MEVLVFRYKFPKKIINHNNIVGFLKGLNSANIMYIILFILGASFNKWFPHSFDASQIFLHLNEEENIKMLQIIMLLGFYSILVYSIISSKDMPKNILKYSTIKGVSNFSNYLGYYSKIFPISLITTGIILTTLKNFHIILLLFGIILLILGIFVYFILYILNIFFNNMGKFDTYNNLARSNDIFINYISSNETRDKNLAIKEFTKHIIRVLDSLDLYLDKGIKIDCLKNKENTHVKQVIIHYLPIYLKHGNEEEIKSFQIKINSLVKLIDNKYFTFSLDIIKVIYSIYQDIVTFLDRNNYAIPKNVRRLNIKYNAKVTFDDFSTYILVIFIVIGLIKDIIPYEYIDKPLINIALLLSPLLPIIFQMILKYYQWIKE